MLYTSCILAYNSSLEVLKIRDSVSLIPSIEGEIPFVNEDLEILDFGVDPLLIINGKSYQLAGLSGGDSTKYRNV